VKKNELISLETITSTYDDYFNEITKLNENDLVYVQDCAFCNHPARSEGELKWEKTGIYTSVEKFFDEYAAAHPEAPKLNLSKVRHHLQNHYEEQKKKIFLREYSNRLKSVMNKRISDENKLEMLKSVFELKLFDLEANKNLCPLKKADAMVKLGNAIMSIMVTSSKIKGEIESSSLLMERFSSVWLQIINGQNNPEVKKILLGALEAFQDSFGAASAGSLELGDGK
jgi:hypothetical protein